MEELRPTGYTIMGRGYRKKMVTENVSRQMITARNTESFLCESRPRDGGDKSENTRGI